MVVSAILSAAELKTWSRAVFKRFQSWKLYVGKSVGPHWWGDLVLLAWRESLVAEEPTGAREVSPEQDASATKSLGCPRPKAEPSGAQAGYL